MKGWKGNQVERTLEGVERKWGAEGPEGVKSKRGGEDPGRGGKEIKWGRPWKWWKGNGM